MPLILSDEQLKEAGLTEQQVRIELACSLYDADLVSKGFAASMAGLDRVSFESELRQRGFPLIHYDDEDFQQDVKTLQRLRGGPKERTCSS